MENRGISQSRHACAGEASRDRKSGSSRSRCPVGLHGASDAAWLGRESPGAETVNSDPAIFYSTRAIAENMGFLKGREMIEGRAKAGAGVVAPGQTP
jgi:hypothetical protein